MKDNDGVMLILFVSNLHVLFYLFFCVHVHFRWSQFDC
jgi:hypothetical protein